MSKGQPLSFDAKAASKYLTDVSSVHGTVYIRLCVGSGSGSGSAWVGAVKSSNQHYQWVFLCDVDQDMLGWSPHQLEQVS